MRWKGGVGGGGSFSKEDAGPTWCTWHKLILITWRFRILRPKQGFVLYGKFRQFRLLRRFVIYFHRKIKKNFGESKSLSKEILIKKGLRKKKVSREHILCQETVAPSGEGTNLHTRSRWKWLQDDVDTICFGKAGSRDHAPSCPVSDMRMKFRVLCFGLVFCCQGKRAFEFSGLRLVLWEPIAHLDTPPMEAQHSVIWLFSCLQWCLCIFRDYVLVSLSTETHCTGGYL